MQCGEPAAAEKVSYTEGAMNKIIEITGRYPYFIQAFCSAIWEETDGNLIDEPDVEKGIADFLVKYGQGILYDTICEVYQKGKAVYVCYGQMRRIAMYNFKCGNDYEDGCRQDFYFQSAAD